MVYISPESALSMKMHQPCRPPLQCLSQFFRNLCWRIGEVADKLPICTREQEYEDDVDEEEQEVSEAKVGDFVNPGSIAKFTHFFRREYSIQLRARYPWRYVMAMPEVRKRLHPVESRHLPSNTKGSKAFKVIMATDGSEFWTTARTLSLLSINRPSHGIDFLISL